MLRAATEHAPSSWRCRAERAVMRMLQGGCQAPIGVLSELSTGTLRVEAFVLSADGSKGVDASMKTACASNEDAVAMGTAIGRTLLDRGARGIIHGEEKRDGESETTRPITYSSVATG